HRTSYPAFLLLACETRRMDSDRAWLIYPSVRARFDRLISSRYPAPLPASQRRLPEWRTPDRRQREMTAHSTPVSVRFRRPRSRARTPPFPAMSETRTAEWRLRERGYECSATLSR